ncbi:MAG: aminopeptidase P family protein [Defluviitaleaceae bacterium]|nr:aminopeptidase P family protein [Defluviitaleaceae bacterium]
MVRERVDALRHLMKQRGLDGYIIPSGDAHASEYVADYWRGREWISGFTGSSGLVVVLPNEAGLWTDGRYFIQAEQELSGSGIKLFKMAEPNVPRYQEFLAEKLPNGAKLGFDGRILTATSFTRLKDDLKEKNINYSYNEDLLDLIWKDRPQMPKGKAFAHEHKFAGATSAEKLADVRVKMKEKKIATYLITALDSVAWLLNIRGSDIKGLPVIYAFALVTENEAHVFVEPEKISDVSLTDFTIHNYNALPEFLSKIKTEIYFNANFTNVLLSESVMNATKSLKPAEEFIPLLKAVKSPCELFNIRNAYIKEGVVLVKMLFWLDNAMRDGLAPTEGDVVRVLQNLRKEQEHYLCDSFTTISAYGENAALAHYSCGEVGAALRAEGFLLVDTGGQYLDGTTDTTRTVCLGEVSDEMKRDFTLILKGHIALARAVFPKGTTGTGLDTLARLPLWESEQNYNHGTGHGIGYCLSVHEGPHSISHHHNTIALAPGMLLTNEPAIYKEGRYGIRTENVLAVKKKNPEGTFLSFENLTYCPIDTRAIIPEMLTEIERDWLADYHKKTYETLSPFLSSVEREWLNTVKNFDTD